MKEILYVIATRGKNGNEIYLMVDEERGKLNPYKVYFKWTNNIENAYADFNGYDIEKFAKGYFKNYNKWYITCYKAKFE